MITKPLWMSSMTSPSFCPPDRFLRLFGSPRSHFHLVWPGVSPTPGFRWPSDCIISKSCSERPRAQFNLKILLLQFNSVLMMIHIFDYWFPVLVDLKSLRGRRRLVTWNKSSDIAVGMHSYSYLHQQKYMNMKTCHHIRSLKLGVCCLYYVS